MAEKSDPLDVAQLARRDLSETAFPGGKPDFRVFFDRKIHQRIAAHAAERLTLEICGMLVGHWRRDADGPFVLVDENRPRARREGRLRPAREARASPHKGRPDSAR